VTTDIDIFPGKINQPQRTLKIVKYGAAEIRPDADFFIQRKSIS
jgi:hypothetical protein